MKTSNFKLQTSNFKLQTSNFKLKYQSFSYLTFLLMFFSLFPSLVKSQTNLRDGSNCGATIILPAPAQTCNRSTQHIKDKEMWFEFTANSEELKVDLFKPLIDPVEEIKKITLYEGECPNLIIIKEAVSDSIHHLPSLEVSNLTLGKKYKLKAERDLLMEGDFEMCLRRELLLSCLAYLYMCSDVSALCFTQRSVNYNYCFSKSDNIDDCRSALACSLNICTGKKVTFWLDNNILGTCVNCTAKWTFTSPTGTSTVVADKELSQSFTFVNSGIHSVNAILKDGNSTVNNTGSIYINVTDQVFITFSGTQTAICQGETTTLTANGADSYSWSPSTGLNRTDVSAVTANPTSTTTYTVTGTNNTTGCTASQDITITVNPNPLITLTTDPTSAIICKGKSAKINANSLADQYTWSNLSTTSAITVTPLTTTPYTVTATYSQTGCSASSTILINVSNPDFSISPPSATLCKGKSVTLSASNPDNTYTWSPGSVLNTTDPATVIASPTIPTTYKVIATNSNGCTASNSVFINVYNEPKPIISGPNNTCNGLLGTYTISNSVSGAIYTWTVSGGIPTTFTGTNTTLNITWNSLSGGTVLVTVNNSGCMASSWVKTVVSCPCDGLITYCNDPSFNSELVYEINTNTIWKVPKGKESQFYPNCPVTSKDVFINKDIIINPGKTLTIVGITVRFSPSSKIIISNGTQTLNGGLLIVDNSTLSATGTCMWQGIEVRGLKVFDHTNANFNRHGRVELKNNAKIEHALKGINCIDGGIVKAHKSSFVDNLIHINFNPFPGKTNASELIESKFISTGPLRNGQHSSSFVFLNGVEGINIQGNTFTNSIRQQSPVSLFPGTAINSTDCKSLDINNCVFNNFALGINHNQTIAGLTPTNHNINLNIFNNVFNGIQLLNGKSDKITNNTMNATNLFNSFPGADRIAIFLMNSEGFSISNNPKISGFDYGIVSDNSNTSIIYYSYIKKNIISFSKRVAVSAGGNNNKLHFLCNELDNYKVSGLNVYDLPYQKTDIKNQGICNINAQPQIKEPAGNHFKVTSTLIDDITVNTSRTGYIFEYIYDATTFATDLSVKPDKVTPATKVNVIECTGATKTETFCNSLPGFLMKNENTIKASLQLVIDSTEKAELLFELLELFLTENRVNEAEQLLVEMNTPETKKLLIPFYIEQKRFADARNLMAHISIVNEENEHFVLYHSLLCDLGEAGKCYNEIENEQLQLVRNISNGKSNASINAHALLGLLEEKKFPITCDLLDNCPQNARLVRTDENINQIIINKDFIPPIIQNPSSEQLIISTDFKIPYSSGLVSIYDITGKKMKEYNISADNTSLIINTKDVSIGLYLLSIRLDGNLIYRSKLSVVR